jgi:hypothetical protein
MYEARTLRKSSTARSFGQTAAKAPASGKILLIEDWRSTSPSWSPCGFWVWQNLLQAFARDEKLTGTARTASSTAACTTFSAKSSPAFGAEPSGRS